MTDVEAAKLRAHAERTMDVIWPSWREMTHPHDAKAAREIHETVKSAVQYGYDAAMRFSATEVETEVQRRIKLVTEHHATQLEALNKETASIVRRAEHGVRAGILAGVRGLGELVARKHGAISMPALLIRMVELGIVNGADS